MVEAVLLLRIKKQFKSRAGEKFYPDIDKFYPDKSSILLLLPLILKLALSICNSRKRRQHI